MSIKLTSGINDQDKFIINSKYYHDLDGAIKKYFANYGSNIASKKCSYCGTVLKDKYLDFTISKIGFIENMN